MVMHGTVQGHIVPLGTSTSAISSGALVPLYYGVLVFLLFLLILLFSRSFYKKLEKAQKN